MFRVHANPDGPVVSYLYSISITNSDVLLQVGHDDV